MSVRWGFLSTAAINDKLLAGARLSDRVEVVAVASRDPGRAEAYARARGIERAHGSYEALLADPGVEAVYISLPNSLHVEWTLRALEAGKHVLCEKPFSRRAAEVERAFDVAERAGLVLSEGFMWRHNPQAATIAKLVREGELGRLRHLRAAFSFPLLELRGADDIRWRADLDGGSLMDVGSYCLSGMRLLAGEPRRVGAEQVVGPTGVDIRFTATLRFDGDVLGQFDCGFELPYRDELEAIGERRTLLADDPWHIRAPGITLRREVEEERVEVEHVFVPRASSYQLELENVSDAIRGEAELLLGRADAVGQARAIEALYRSAETGAPVDLV